MYNYADVDVDVQSNIERMFFSDSNGGKKIPQLKDIESRHHPMILLV